MDEKCSSRVPYPGSIFTVEGGSEEVKARIGEAWTTFNMFNKIWKAGNLCLKAKLQIFNSTRIGNLENQHT